MPQIFVFTAGQGLPRQHLKVSIERPIEESTVFSNFPENNREELKKIHEQANGFYAWGAIPGPSNRKNWNLMKPWDYVLCVYDATYHYVFRVLAKYDNRRFAETVWGTKDSATWQLMYFLTEPVEVGRRLPGFGDYLYPTRYRGFTRIDDNRMDKIISSYSSVGRFIADMLGRGFQGAVRTILRAPSGAQEG